MKKISIVIATFNASQTLEACLNSIIPQLTEECELIIIDGASTDATNGIVSSYADKIAYKVSERDNGIYDAWNKGVKAATGSWVMFIGADDILLPNALSEYLKIVDETPNIDAYDYICARNEYVDMKGQSLKILGEPPIWQKMRKTMPAAHVASLHNKSNLFETIGGYDLSFKICADYELLLRKKNKLKFLFTPVRIARMKVGGMSFSTKAIIEAYHIRKKHRSVNRFFNVILLIRDWLAFRFFIIRKRARGNILK